MTVHQTSDTQDLSIGLLEFAKLSMRSESDHLATCFAELATRVDILCTQLKQQASEVDNAKQVAARLQTEEIAQLTKALVVDIQVHDITDQRLSHVGVLLSNEIADTQEQQNLSLDQKVAKVLTESGEKEVAKHLLQGATLRQAMAAANSLDETKIELF